MEIRSVTALEMPEAFFCRLALQREFRSANTGSRPPEKSMRSRRFCARTARARMHSFSTQRYESLSRQDVEHFASICSIQKDASILERHATDWTRHYRGTTPLLLQPKSTEEVSNILRYCNERRLPVVPQAGNTSLVGGSVPTEQQEIVISTHKMNRVEVMDTLTGILRCEAGCILQDVQNYAAARDYLVPIDLGAKGSCQIGGNLSTNAGGAYFYRYGSLAGNVLGMEAVLPDGRVIDINYKPSTNLKDNTGYKLHQLLIGSEGTLGIITKVALLCPPLPQSRQTVWMACPNYDAVLQLLRAAKRDLGEILAAMELLDHTVLQIVGERRSVPVALDHESRPYHILLETHGSSQQHDHEKVECFLEKHMELGAITDGVLAQHETQREAFWTARESCNPVMGETGYTYKYDISLPISQFDDFIRFMTKHLDGLDLLQTNWGHVLDSNLHFNVTKQGVFEVKEDILRRLEPFLFHEVILRGGSISAEHGVGQHKREFLSLVHSPDTLSAMHQLKDTLDPISILCPYKFLPDKV